ncbi:MAG: hypothetical protein Q7J16_12270 [Candidatus Cloacimonadales bacterium]|nr:hypothetical protein [Candidatus Cloacimonadales bacterium]
MKKIILIIAITIMAMGLFAGDVEGYVKDVSGNTVEGISVTFCCWDYTFAQWYEFAWVVSGEDGYYSMNLHQVNSEQPAIYKLEASNPNGTNPRYYYYYWPGHIDQDIVLIGFIEP